MDQGRYYILLKDTMGEGRWEKRNPRRLPGGTILCLLRELKQPEDHGKISLTNGFITVECSKLDVSQLTDSEHDLLGAVDSEEERLSLYRDKNRLTEAKTLEVGCEVFVKLRKENAELQLPGVIRWKGRLYFGTQFGVELISKESEGCGDNDGTYDFGWRRVRYFTCPANQGVFVAVDKLRLRQVLSIGQRSVRRVGELAAPLDSGVKDETERRLHRSDQRANELELSLAAERHTNQESQRRLRSNEQRLHQFELSLAAERSAHEETQRRLRSNEQRLQQLQLSLAAERSAHEETQRSLRSNEQRLQQLQLSLAAESSAHEETQRRLRSNEERLEFSLMAERRAHEETRRRLQSSEERALELETTLTTVRQSYEDLRRSIESTRDWVVSRQEIRLSDKVIGVGAWGEVKEGTFRGCKVAVKTIHQLILSDHNRRLFEREMNMASRCRHPCLLQFIGATNDDESPFFVTELLDTSLRAVLHERTLEPPEITSIALDVAKGLNYLHLSHPAPIIHRDISSANVLLWKHVPIWRAKVSDYGTANILQQTMTVGPGAVIYSAPEAQTSRQSPKLDVYSFGVLLCEMNVREMADPDHRNQQVAMVTNSLFRNLIRRCLQQNPEERPSMAEIIETLERSPQ